MKKSSKKKGNNLLEKIIAFLQIKSVRTTLFFGFYFFFFLFLFLNFDIDSFNNQNNNQIQGSNESNTGQNNNSNNTTKPTTWEFNTLIKDNYGYTYTINENDKTTVFNGRISEPNTSINEYQYNYFLNLYNINQITKNSKYVSKNLFYDGYRFNYEISNKSLGKLLENNNVLLNDELNIITIYTNSNMLINKVELELTSLMKELNDYSNYKIVLEYENK